MPSGTKPKSAESWDEALKASRQGEVARAREICAIISAQAHPFAGSPEYLLGRCLAEAERGLEEAIELLTHVTQVNPKHILAPQVLALALMRAGREGEAAGHLKRTGLPHNLDLLAQMALTMETRRRPLPESPPERWPVWPDGDAMPSTGSPETAAGPPDSKPRDLESPEASESSDDPSREAPGGLEPVEMPPPIRLTRSRNRKMAKKVGGLERLFSDRKFLDLAREVAILIREGPISSDLHLIAGLTCLEAGDASGARFHLASALEMKPENLLARTFLGRVYWRYGWNDLATDLWRSLPVEGPDDSGRHYHLALAHEAEGRRIEALEAMNVALSDFFIETREFFIELAYLRWMESAQSPQAKASPS